MHLFFCYDNFAAIFGNANFRKTISIVNLKPLLSQKLPLNCDVRVVVEFELNHCSNETLL